MLTFKEAYYMGKHRSDAWHADGGANDEGWDDHKPSHKPADHPHSVHINGKKWKTFGSHSHATNVARKIKGATVHKEEVELREGAYEKAEENKRSADAAKKQGDMFAHHLHMADHHDNMAQWHGEKGRHGEADRHAEKAEQHHEKAMALKEEAKQIDELSSDLLSRYKEKASAASSAADKAGNYDLGHKRYKGILKATLKQFANDAKK